ncbi:MAG TPA: selenoneine synthase SenA [Candidatus Binatia bacterium]|nr:selenoneine synthase SenA [Candidatus Binatia bacterium]
MADARQSTRGPGAPLAQMTGRRLIPIMREFRSRTLDLAVDLDDEQMIGPSLPIVNPPLWEIGHIAWFQEFWVLRHLKKQPPLLEHGDRLYNSTDVAHDTRWELLLPERRDTLRYMEEVLERCIEYLDRARDLSQDEHYFYLLAAFHEGMHAEALAYTRQTLGYPSPRFREMRSPAPEPNQISFDPGDVEIPGGEFMIGASADFPFVFDNEKWAHPVEVQSFRMARAPVTNGDFLAFVEAGGYHKARFWSEAGWHWLKTGGAPQLEQSFAKFFNRSTGSKTAEPSTGAGPLDHPVYWRCESNGRWLQRIFDRYVPLQPHLPVVHVNWYEAEAYCNWAGRRLPREAEWEVAASAAPARDSRELGESRRYFPWGNDAPVPERANLDWQGRGIVEVGAHAAGDAAFGCRQMIGNVWEWTADNFLPYPGFIVDPYKEYSKPWFGSHKVLRGGCWATSSLLIRNTWRNFYTPDRRDVWAGFRTCAK